MKKALLSVLTFILIFSSLFCLSACGGSKKVEVYLFDTEENRSWQYSEKVTFNLGEKSGEDKNIYAYFRENARKVKIKEEKLLRAEYFFRTTVYVDTDILDKTFDDQSLKTSAPILKVSGGLKGGEEKGESRRIQSRRHPQAQSYGQNFKRRSARRSVQKLLLSAFEKRRRQNYFDVQG